MSFKLGVVTHYYHKLGMAIVVLDNPIGKGDHINIVENNEDVFQQQVREIQIDTEKVDSAAKGQVIGLKLEQEVNPGAEIYKTQTI